MIKTVVLLPIRDNVGRQFPRALWHEWNERLLQFGGFSWSVVDGVWRAGDRTYADRSRQYTVALTSWTQLPAWLHAVAWAHSAFRQEAIYIEVQGVPEILESG